MTDDAIAQIDALEKTLEKALRERDQYRKMYELLSEEVQRLRRGLLGGQQAERVDPSQTQLAFDAVRDLILAAAARAGADAGGGDAGSQETEGTGSSGEPSASSGNGSKSGSSGKRKDGTRPGHGRSKNPEHLPVERIEIIPAEVQANPELFERIDEETSEVLERRAATLVRAITVRPKFVVRRPSKTDAKVEDAPCARRDEPRPCAVSQPSCEEQRRCWESPIAEIVMTARTVAERESVELGRATTAFVASEPAPRRIFIAEVPQRAIERCRAGPGLLAHVLVSKYADHIPWNRMEKIFAREGVDLSRSTLCEWSMTCAEKLKGIVSAMFDDARKRAHCICIDATGVLVQQKERCRWGHFWVMIADRDHVLFSYSRTHDKDVPLKLLKGYAGYLLADASSVYEALYGLGDVTEVACWAHTRRYFHKALPTDRERALAALGFISKLFAIEREIADLPPARKVAERQRRSRPVVDAFEAWTDVESLTTLPKSPLAAGLTYATNQRAALRRFLEDGRLRLDNNPSELELRRQAVGRKNWLFVATDDGAEANATLVSVIASCELHDIDPWAYLRDVLTVLPETADLDPLELAPLNWNATRERLVRQGLLPDVAQRPATAA